MADFYDRMQGVSKRLINAYGTSCQLIDADGVTVLSTQNGVAGVVKQDDYANTLTEKAEGVIFIAPILVVPSETHYLLWNNELHKIIYVNIYKPAAKEVLYGLYVRR